MDTSNRRLSLAFLAGRWAFVPFLALVAALGSVPILTGQPKAPAPQAGEMAGYLLVPHDRVAETYNGGFSLHVAAWPLLSEYPGNRFQTGLFGTWMFAQNEKESAGKHYSDIEGGLGWWRDTRFATTTPKFIMGGVALNFVEWANGPGAGKGRDWANPKGQYGIAQLSPWVLWPPDGLNLKQGTCGELFGYGYLPLPLTEPKKMTAGKDVPTGNHCWTLFLNSGNFKGPVTFFLPYFWSKASVTDPTLAGTFLDSRPSKPNKSLQMETQYIPCHLGQDGKGDTYARIAPTAFPRNAEGVSPVVHRITAYNKAALWDSVDAWFKGGPAATGTIDPKESVIHKFGDRGGSTWRMYPLNTPKEMKTPLAWNSFATPIAIDETTFGFRWNKDLVRSSAPDEKPVVWLPEYYRLGKDSKDNPLWIPVDPKTVPAETGLAKVTFTRPNAKPADPYVTPEDAESSWKKPGSVAGPFQAKLGDGSVVTYSWYRFADQPALLHADLTPTEREALQKRVELIHRHWTREKQYLPPPTVGKLADLDPAVIVTPPKGFEIGYVPIVTRQAAN